MTPAPTSAFSSRLLDQRGVALPLAMIMLMILTALMLAFASMSKHEPVIAANHLRVAQARAMAESGMERALWALSTSTIGAPSAGVNSTTSGYDGTYTEIKANYGGFVLTVTGSSTSVVDIVSVGWVPTNDTSDGRTKAHRKITATLNRFPDMGKDAPCALCLNGDLGTTGNVNIDARPASGTSCGTKKGVWTSGTYSYGGSSAVYGGSDSTANESGEDFVTGQTDFSSFQLSSDEIATLRSYAKSSGTYLQPSSAGGSVTLSNVANGVLFVDSFSGSTMTASDTTTVNVGPGAFADSTGFHGWIIVNGNASFSGNFGGITGMLYVVGRVTQMTGMGNAGITGLMIVERLLGGDSSAAGNANITYSCTAANGDGEVPTNWYLKTGTYREVSGQ